MNLPNLENAKKRTKNKVEILNNIYLIPDEMKNIGINKNYYIRTYGCQMNEHDSENIKAIMEDMGYKNTDDMNNANVVILNTCAIRENAHDKVFGFLGRVKHLKETNKDIITILCGCMAQEENVIESIMKKHSWVDIVFGTHNIYNLPKLLYNTFTTKQQEIEVFSIEGDIIENLPVKRDSKYKAWVNIMFGCDKFCTYCIVPYTRGKQRSRSKEDIIKEVEDLKKNGYKEITLLGQNVNSYGKDLYSNYFMENLLEDVAKTNVDRIRFVTSHPWDFTDNMIDIISKYKNIMPYIHLPIQSGSNKILKSMNRRYTKEDYITLFDKLKLKITGVAISTDIIVGFPMETDQDFNDTLEVVNYCKFDFAFSFIYSKREKTPAALMEDNINYETKQERLYKLNNTLNNYFLEKNKQLLDKTVPVLIEGISDKDKTKLFGYTDTMKLVNITGDSKYIGQIVNIRITNSKSFSLDGVIVS